MGDPGLASKFVEMQQDEHFEPSRERDIAETPYERGARLDCSRIERALAKATHPNHRKVLERALRDAKERLNMEADVR